MPERTPASGRKRAPETDPGIDVRRARLKFALIFAGLGSVLLGLYSFPYGEFGIREWWVERYLEAYARVAGALLRLSDPGVRVIGREVTGRTSLTMVKNCDAMDVTLLLIAAILASPTGWRHRIAGIAACAGLLHIANLARIVSLYHVSVHAPRAFDVVHAEVWPLGLVVLTTSAFVAWHRWAVRLADERR